MKTNQHEKVLIYEHSVTTALLSATSNIERTSNKGIDHRLLNNQGYSAVSAG